MADEPSSSLVPSKDEIKQIIAQALQTNPMQVPNVLLQIQFARFMAMCLDKMKSNLDSVIDDMENGSDKET